MADVPLTAKSILLVGSHYEALSLSLSSGPAIMQNSSFLLQHQQQEEGRPGQEVKLFPQESKDP